MHARITSGITSRYTMHCIPTVREICYSYKSEAWVTNADLPYCETLQNHTVCNYMPMNRRLLAFHSNMFSVCLVFHTHAAHGIAQCDAQM